jgi:putative spermidine/putrescine transport system ATP-binding protein
VTTTDTMTSETARTPASPAGSRFGELRLNGISRAYGAHTALHPLDLTVRGGEFIALLGPSGCGKTTALNSIAGLLPLTAGSIELDGRRVDTLPPEKRGFGMVFQSYALFPHLSVRRNVAFGLRMRKVAKAEIERRADAVLALVRLTEHAHKLPGQLSGGRQQRVAIARAIVLEPPLVLMDEPLSNLDAALRLDMRAEIRRIHQEYGLTTLHVTHDQEEALSLADRLVVLNLGRVAQIGTAAELYESRRSAYVAAFMGYRNILNLTAESVDGTAAVAGGEGMRLVGTVSPPGAVSEGTPVQVAVRPEDLRIAPDGADQAFEALAELVEYHGREFQVDALTRSGPPGAAPPAGRARRRPHTAADPARVIAVAALFCYPFIYGLGLSFQPAKGGVFGAYSSFFSDSFSEGTIWKTFSLAILGTVLTAEGILEYFGPVGWFNLTLQKLGLVSAGHPVTLINDYWGVLFSLIISGFPFAFLLTHSYLSGIHPALEKAAATLDAGWWQHFRFVTFPAAAAGPAHHPLPHLRARILRLPLGAHGRRSGRQDPRDLGRGVRAGAAELQLSAGLRRRRDHDRVDARRHRADHGCQSCSA